MSSDSNVSSYVLHRDTVSSLRLNLQHYIWKEEDGFLLHPRIPSLGKARIADIGSGTGIWAMQVAKELPEAQVDGFDISLEQTPPKAWAPPNVKFEQWDIYTEVPEHLVGQYDIVHLRLLYLVIKNQDPSSVIQKLRKLFQPGGWLQWAEIDPNTLTQVAIPGHSADHLRAAMVYPKEVKLIQAPTWVPNLGRFLEQNGLQVRECVQKDLSDHNRIYYHDTALIAWDSMRLRMNAENGKRHQELMEMAAKERAESGRGVAMAVLRRTLVAQKP